MMKSTADKISMLPARITTQDKTLHRIIVLSSIWSSRKIVVVVVVVVGNSFSVLS